MNDFLESHFSIKDIFSLINRNKKRLFIFSILFGLFIVLFRLLPSVEYQILASYQAESLKQGEKSLDLLEIMGKSSKKSSAKAIMLSNFIIKPVIEKCGLQVVVKTPIIKKISQNIWQNLKNECFFTIFSEPALQFENVDFQEIEPKNFFLQIFPENDLVKVFDEKKKFLTGGKIGEKITFNKMSFTLTKLPKINRLLKHHLYPIKMIPWQSAAKKLLRKLKISPHKDDPSILLLTLLYPKKQIGENILDQIMKQYQSFIKSRYEESAHMQKQYFEKRLEELKDQLLLSLKNFSMQAKEDPSLLIENELTTLYQAYMEQQNQLLAIELNRKKLKEFQNHSPDLSFEKEFFDFVQKKDKLLLQKKSLVSSLEVLEEQNVYQKEQKFEGLDFSHLQEELSKNLMLMKSLQLSIDELKRCISNIGAQKDISSFHFLFTDEISQKLLTNYQQLRSQISDNKNYSFEERKDLQNLLSAKVQIFKNHLDQMIDQKQREFFLLKKSSYGLKKLMIDHLDQEVLAIEKLIKDTLDVKDKKLKLDKEFHLKKIQKIQEKFKQLPQKWQAEKKLRLDTNFSEKMMEEFVKMMESAAVKHSLFQENAKPLDMAISSLDPKKPYLFLYFILASSIGFFFSFIYLFLIEGIKGFPVSMDVLLSMHQKVCGKLSKATNYNQIDHVNREDLETLRKILGYLEMMKIPQKTIGVLINEGPNYLFSLAALLSFSQKKVLIISLKASNKQGFMNYLANETKELPIESEQYFDRLSAGEGKSFVEEAMLSPLFEQMITLLQKKYDQIIFVSPQKLSSFHLPLFMNLCNSLIVSVKNETMHDLQLLMRWEKENQNNQLLLVKY